MSHSKENVRVVRLSNGDTLIGRVLGITEAAISMDCVFQLLTSTGGATAYLPWLAGGVDSLEPLDINILHLTTQGVCSEEFYEGWEEAVETYQAVLEEEMDEKAKEAKGQITKDEIDQLLEEYEEEQRKKTLH